MSEIIRSWLVRQFNVQDTLQAIAFCVGLALTEFGSKRVVGELRRLADYLERTGRLPQHRQRWRKAFSARP